jgi:hypothetical protein
MNHKDIVFNYPCWKHGTSSIKPISTQLQIIRYYYKCLILPGTSWQTNLPYEVRTNMNNRNIKIGKIFAIVQNNFEQTQRTNLLRKSNYDASNMEQLMLISVIKSARALIRSRELASLSREAKTSDARLIYASNHRDDRDRPSFTSWKHYFTKCFIWNTTWIERIEKFVFVSKITAIVLKSVGENGFISFLYTLGHVQGLGL